MTARALVARSRKEIEDEALRDDLVELIETVILYKLPRLSREEIQAMLQVHDLRQTRIYQELREELGEELRAELREKLREECLREGIEKSIEKGIEKKGIEKGIEEERQRNLQEKLRSIGKMAALKMSAATIADLLGVDVDLVHKEMARNPS